MLAELDLRTARRAEQAMGPAAAIVVVTAALETSAGEARRTLLLAGLGAAIRANDASAFAAFTTHWARAGGAAGETRGVSLVARLGERGETARARQLARAEVDRHRSAEAVFALAAILEMDGDDAFPALYREPPTLGAGTPIAA